MEQKSKALAALRVGTLAALCLASTLMSACAVRQPYDFPVMRLTSAPVADTGTDTGSVTNAQPSQ
jgi:hypothetical protein